MDPIYGTIAAGDSGPKVANLQSALRTLLERGLLDPRGTTGIATIDSTLLIKALDRERATSTYGAVTRQLVRVWQAGQGLDGVADGNVDPNTAKSLNAQLTKLGAVTQPPAPEQPPSYVVHGRVIGGKRGMLVKAYDVDFRSEESLGKATLADDEQYRITYDAPSFALAEHGTADLRVAVCEPGGRELVSSAITFNADADATVDLSLAPAAPPPAEYERYVAEVTPVMQGVTLREVAQGSATQQARDIDFLARELGIDRAHVGWLVRAAGFEAQGRAIDDRQGHLPAEVFYGWFREGVPDTWDALVSQPLTRLRSALLAAIDHREIAESMRLYADHIAAAIPNPQRDALQTVATRAGLAAGSLTAVLQRASSLNELTNSVVTDLVANKQLQPNEARALGLGVTMQQLVDGNDTVAGALASARVPLLGGGTVQRPRDLAALRPADVQQVLQKAGYQPPDHKSLNDVANSIVDRIAQMFPNDVLISRVIAGDARLADDDSATKRAAALQQLQAQNPDLDLLAIDYLPDSETVGAVQFGALDTKAKRQAISDLKALQRAQALGGNPDTAIALTRAGLTSSRAITRLTFDDFVNASGLSGQPASATYAMARQKVNEAAIAYFGLYDLARDGSKQHRYLFGPPPNLIELPGYQDIFGNLVTCDCCECKSVLGPAAYFVDLMWYVDRNISGPTFKNHGGETNPMHLRSRRPDLWTLPLTCSNAERIVPYLDIVIRILESYIVDQVPGVTTASLYSMLATQDGSMRQPFSLPLEKLGILLGHFELTRYDIAKCFVLGNADADQQRRVRCRLGLTPLEYGIITGTRLGSPPTAATLGVAKTYYESQLIVATNLSTIPTDAETRFIDPIGSYQLRQGMGVERDALLLLVATSFIHASDNAAARRVTIKRGITTTGNVQNDTELITQLTFGRLDRLERFTRLWRRTPWNVVELDYVIGRLQATIASAVTPAPEGRIDTPMLAALVQLFELQNEWTIPVDVLCALWDQIPTQKLRDDIPLFDRIFNQPNFIKAATDNWPSNSTFTFPELPNAAGSNVQARLLASLQLSDAQLADLFTGLSITGVAYQLSAPNLADLYRHATLAKLLGLTISDLFVTIGLTLTTPKITSLGDLLAVRETNRWVTESDFRLDQIQYITGSLTSLAELGSPSSIVAALVADVKAEGVLEFADTVFTAIGLTEADSRAVTADNLSITATDGLALEQVPNATTYRLSPTWDPSSSTAPFVFNPQASAVIVAATARAAYDIALAAGGTGFADDAFLPLGMTAAESSAFVAANTAGTAPSFQAIGAAGNRYVLVPGMKAADAVSAIIVTSGVTLQAVATRQLRDKARALLVKHHPMDIVTSKQAAALTTTAERIQSLVALTEPPAGADTPARAVNIAVALQGGPTNVLEDLVGKVSRLSVLLENPVFDSDAIAFVGSKPKVFGLSLPLAHATDALTIGVDSVRRVALYVAAAQPADPAYGDASTDNSSALRTILSATTGWAAANAKTLGSALRIDPAQAQALRDALAPKLGSDIDGLDQLRRAAALAKTLGAAATTLNLAVSDNFADLTSAVDGVRGLFRSHYADDATFAAKVEPYDDRIRSRQRDGLVDYLIHPPVSIAGLPGRFATPNDMYHVFLIDVSQEGCARTSELVSAISCVQLYVYRVIMHLEQSDSPPLSVDFGVIPNADPRAEWSWRQNYRLWQANRKVFLFPENYVEPGLRDDKTPLFKELEEALLQKQLTDQSVLDAYANYLHGLDELARLEISGAYHDTQSDILHLFGVTPSDPPVHYYRAVQNLQQSDPREARYGPWLKIDLQISARKVSPIVFRGRLFVFWIELSTRPISEFSSGSTKFKKYRHSVRTRFSQLRLDGKWTSPQTLKVEDDSQARSDVRIVDDLVSQYYLEIDTANGSVLLPKTPFDNTDPDFQSKLQQWQGQTGWKVIQWLPAAEFDTRNRDHTEPIENYTPEGPRWERTYPGIVGQAPSQSLVTMFVPRSDGQSVASQEVVDLWSGAATPNGVTTQTDLLSATMSAAPSFGLSGLTLPSTPEAQIVGGNTQSRIYDVGGQVVFAQSYANDYRLWRLSSSLISTIGEQIATGKLESMLSTDFQLGLQEDSYPLGNPTISAPGMPAKPFPPSTPTNPQVHTLARYIRELFFHIPFLLADFSNSRQLFDAALQWYSYLFDPTAADAASATGGVWRYAEFRQLAADPSFKDLSAQFANGDQLWAYANDPFNPHAIARLRPSAYPKAIFMRYVDTLLDWGDSLFTEFTMESVNEATMLYVMAAEILGPRPESVGPCGTDQAATATYATIAPTLTTEQPDDFLIEEVELLSVPAQLQQENDGTYVALPPAPKYAYTVRELTAEPLALGADGNGNGSYGDTGPAYGTSDPVGWNTPGNTIWSSAGGTSLAQVYAGATALGGAGAGNGFTMLGNSAPALPLGGDPIGPPETPLGGGLAIGGVVGGAVGGLVPGNRIQQFDGQYSTGAVSNINTPSFKPVDLLDSKLVFCIPENDELLAYWDRVENRLYNIRNCMDISGVRRLPDLFAPPIDPHMLVRLRAAGLSLDDVMNATSGDLPPYRFAYLIDKAKQHASTLQSFGNSLQSAMEKRDTEELQRLRTIHEQNLLTMRIKTMDLESQAAEDTLESLQRQQVATEYRRDHFTQLLTAGLSGSETLQESAQALSGAFNTAASIYQGGAAIAHLIAQVGAPTSMKYGGAEVGAMLQNLAGIYSALGSVEEIQSRAAAGRASFERRAEEWKHQVDTANKELDVLAKQITAAQFRVDIANEAKDIHQTTIDQAEEVFELMQDRFSNFGRFVWLSTELQKLNRHAFNSALAMARLAERAYRFERPETGAETLIGDSYWDATNGGLLAGDRLLIDLQQLERQFIETNYRTLEVEQSFALSQLDPSQLLKLREQGSCTFSIPEMAFALTYPGQYQRRIKSVRLSIPCVTGPYLNIGATLRLTGSRIRQNPKLTDALVDVPLRHSTTIAASSAQNDAGVFEFSFRDERYMPFEGAGAVSDWELTLPKNYRVFDYRTISDVIVRINYTAEDDDDLRDAVESTTSTTAGALHAILKTTGVPIALSLRHDFPDAWRMLVSSPANTTVSIDVTERQLPGFIAGWLYAGVANPTVSYAPTGLAFVMQGAVSSAKPTAGISIGIGSTGALTAVAVGGTPGTSGLFEAPLNLTSSLSKTATKATVRVSVTDAGNVAPDAGSLSTALIDEGKLRDVVLLAIVKIGP